MTRLSVAQWVRRRRRTVDSVIALALMLLIATAGALGSEAPMAGSSASNVATETNEVHSRVGKPGPIRLPAGARNGGEPIEDLLRQVGTPAETRECCGICGRCATSPGTRIEHERKCPLRESSSTERLWLAVGVLAVTGVVILVLLALDPYRAM